MRLERDDAKVGLVVLAALLVFGGLLFYRSLSALLRKETAVLVQLADVSDLAVGTGVQLQGLKVGRVKAIDLQREGVEYRFVATLALRPDLMLWRGTKGVVVSKLVGGSFLDLRLPEPAERREVLAPGALLEGGTSASLPALIDQMQAFVGNLNGALTELRGHVRARGLGAVLDHPQVRGTFRNLDGTLTEVRALVAEGRDAVKRNDVLLERNLVSLERSLAVLQNVLESRREEVDAIVLHLAGVLKELEGLSAETRAFLKTGGPEAEEALKALNRNLRTSEELLQILKAKPNRVVWGTPSATEQETARRKAEEARRAEPSK